MSTDINPGLLERYEFMCAQWGRGNYRALWSWNALVVTGIVAAVAIPTFRSVVVVFIVGAVGASFVVAALVGLRVSHLGKAGAEEAFATIQKETLAPCATAQCNREVYYNVGQKKYLHLGAGSECSTVPVAVPVGS